MIRLRRSRAERILAAALLVVVSVAWPGAAATPDINDLCTIFPEEAGIVYTTPNDAREPAPAFYCVAIYGQKLITRFNAYSSTGSALIRSYNFPDSARLILQRSVDDWRRSGYAATPVQIGDAGWEIGLKDEGRVIWVRGEYYMDSASREFVGTGDYAGMASTAAQAMMRARHMDAALAQAIAARTGSAPPATVSPTPTPEPEEDRFSIAAIEVVQAVQTAENDVPLVAGKRTVVRVFPRDSKDEERVSGATGKLRVITSTGKTVDVAGPENGPITIQPDPQRLNIAHSLNFVLPDELTEPGVVTLEAELVPPSGIKQKDGLTARLNIRFDRLPGWPAQYRVAYLDVCHPTPSDCPSDAIADADALLAKVFPLGERSLSYFALPSGSVTWRGSLETSEDKARFKAFLRKLYDLIEASSPGTMDQLAAWLPASANTGGTNGSSDPLFLRGSGHVTWQVERSPAQSQRVLAHEIAHNLGLRHTARTNAEKDRPDHCGALDPDTGWPYKDGTVQELGFDAVEQKVLGVSRHDLMTYCSDTWISPYSFQQLFDARFAPPPGAAAPRPVAVVGGSVRADGTSGTLGSAYRLMSRAAVAASDPSGAHCLRFSGGTTVTHCFDLPFRDHLGEDLEEESFSLLVEVPEGTTGMSLVRGGRVLDDMASPAAPPAITITGPEAGTALPPSHEIAWTSTGSGGATYAVLYSADAGSTWFPLALDETGTSVTVDTSKLRPGDDIRFRVIGADGLATTIAESPSYRIAGAEREAPIAALLTALAGAAMLILLLRGRPRRAPGR